MKQKWLVAIAAIGIVALFIFFFRSAAYSSRSGEDTPLYSARRHDPYGVAALFDLLTQRGTPVRLLERPRLEHGDHGVLIQVLTDKAGTTAEFHLASAELVDWMAQGNTVVQLTRSNTELLQRLKMAPTTRPAMQGTDLVPLEDFEKLGGDPVDAPAVHSSARTTLAGTPQLLLWSPVSFKVPSDSEWKPLARLKDKDHSVVAAELKVGRGRFMVVGAPTPALNATIADQGNLDFLMNVIGDSPVILDEWSHGIGHERTIVSFLRDVGLLPVLFQIALVAGLYVWSTSGSVSAAEVPERRQRSSVEQIETLGYLYSRSLDRSTVFERVRQEVERRLSAALRCQPRDVTARLALLSPELRKKVERLLARLRAVRVVPALPCQQCGYDLSFNRSKKCPECGTPIRPEIQAKILDAEARAKDSVTGSTQSLSASSQRTSRLNAALADTLSASHQLSLEIIRERRSAR